MTCNFGDLDSGKAASAILVVDVDSAAPEGPITNISAALSSTADPDLSNNGDTETTQLSTTIVDLAVAKGESADPAPASSPLVYTLAVSNSGPSNATGVVVSDTLPTGVSLAGTWASQGSCSAGAVVTCQLGGLAAGAQATAVLTVTIDSATTGVILNSASVGGAEADANTANNSSQIVTTVIPQADLELAKAGSPDPVVAGVSALTYTLTVINRGPSLARALTLTDTLPTGLTLLSTSPPTCSAPPGPVVCTLPDLNPDAVAVLTLYTTVDSGASGTLLNQAEVASSADDPNPGDNTASAATSVTQDTTPPTVTWTAPVTAGERFDVGAARSVRLEVQAMDNLGVEKVRFIRWDAVHNQYVQVGEDFSAPYTWDLDTRTLNPEWNQIFAQAFDLAGNTSPPPPAAPFIWLYRWDIFLPLLTR